MNWFQTKTFNNLLLKDNLHLQASRLTQNFNAIYATPKNLTSDSNIPLLVDIHGGPEKLVTTGFNHRAITFVELGYAVLMINYRGSVGNGDAILQSILGNIAKVS
jgi:acylaminoacyl-peptidase